MSNIPANLQSVIHDFCSDLTTTFPEYAFLWKKWTNPELDPRDLEELFLYLTKVFPERFFDILYQNDEIFQPDSEINTQFLPNVEFKILFNCTDITDTTRKAIWKYLQLVLMTILKSVQDKTGFGESASLFDGVNEEDLQEKLNETLSGISDFFKNLGQQDGSGGPCPDPDAFFDKMAEEGNAAFQEEFKKTFDFEGMPAGMPKAEDLHEHLKGLFDGKIGSLAKELAEEISKDIEHLFEEEGETSNIRTTQDLLKKMMRNPKKMMDLMKNIGGKLQDKMKRGDISQEELMKEASELMGKMKGGKGMGEFGEIFKNLAKGMGGGAKPKFNTGAFQRMEKQMATKERMLQKMAEKKEQKESAIKATDDPNKFVFSLGEGEKQERSARPLADEDLVNLFDKPEPKKSGKKKNKGKTKV
jgi:hypothetical protein